jgi:hypothetical protein
LPPVAGSVTFQPSAVKVPPLRRVALELRFVSWSVIVVAAAASRPKPAPNHALSPPGAAAPNMAAVATAAVARMRAKLTKDPFLGGRPAPGTSRAREARPPAHGATDG